MSFRFVQKTGIVAVVLLLFCCKAHNKNKPVFFLLENKAEIQLNSSCRNSSLSPLGNEAELKNKMLQYSKESVTKLHLKTSDTPEKANYRITQTVLTITEKCGDQTSGVKSQIYLQQVLTLEDTITKESLQFKSDTAVIDQSALAQPGTLVQKKPDLEPYLSSLTTKNYIQLKKHFGIK
jgi:hypothetical protein